jgi:hypothetical protein
VPPGCHVTILADRGFGDQKLSAFLGELGFDYVIRFRGNIHVANADGQTKLAIEWVGKGARARKLRDARATAKGQQVGAVVGVQAGHAGQSLRQALDHRATVPFAAWTVY